MTIPRCSGLLLIALLFTACGGNRFVGAYELDQAAMIAAMQQNMPKTPGASTEETARMLEGMAKSMSGALEIKADQTLTLAGTLSMTPDQRDTGTWREDGDAIVVTTSGKKELRCTLDNGLLVCTPVEGKLRGQMIFRRK